MRKMKFWMIFILSLVPLCGFSAVSGSSDIKVGSYFSDAWNGISLISGNEAAFLMRIGWVDSDRSYRSGNYGYKFNNYHDGKYVNGHIGERPVAVGPAAPDQTYSKISWKVNAAEVMLEWAKSGSGYVARVCSDAKVRIAVEMAPSWLTFSSYYSIADSGIDGYGELPGGRSLPFCLRADRKPDFAVCLDGKLSSDSQDAAIKLSAEAGIRVVKKEPKVEKKGRVAMLVYDLMPGEYVHLAAGIGAALPLKQVSAIIEKGRKEYMAKRTWAEGDWGDFVSPISQNLAQTRLYNYLTHDITYSVSRSWSYYDGVVLFNWDSFFNSLMGTIEDPETAKNNIRGVLKGQLDNGNIPNFSGPLWGTSTGRSQRSVVGMCVWKIYQRWPDKDFLKEIFDRLVMSHDWWLKEREEDGLPHRDANRSGILDHGEDTGDLQGTCWDGLDNSPTWEETLHTRLQTRSVRIDQVDISALWIADAHYLAMIADEIGKHEVAVRLLAEADEMAKKLDKFCWSERMGMYCNRFWDLNSIMPVLPIPQECLFTVDGHPGLKGEYYSGTDFNELLETRNDAIIDNMWYEGAPAEGLPADHFSVRWTGRIKPLESGRYILGARAENGVRVWLDGRLVIDEWIENTEPEWVVPSAPRTGMKNKGAYQSKRSKEVFNLVAGKFYDIKIEFRHFTGPASMILRWYRCSDDGEGLFAQHIGASNLYPFIAHIPDRKKAARMEEYLTDTRKLWGKYVIPTLSRDDPYFNQHHYWKGRIWAPSNYLFYQGLKNYVSDEIRMQYAEKSVRLFMKNWIGNGCCWENYHTTGEGGDDPHYTWGALLCLIGLEEICDIEPDGRIRLNGRLEADIVIHNLPLWGKMYDVRVTPHKTELIRNGKVVMKAENSVVREKII